MGRKTKLTLELQTQLCKMLNAGSSIPTACLAVGITDRTYQNWMDRGIKAEDEEYRSFYEEVTKALAQAKVRNEAILQKAAAEDWRAALAWLERRYPEEWGKYSQLIKQRLRGD